MLSISQRPAHIGSSVNSRVEKHGDDDVTAFDIPITGIPLEAEEINQLLQDPHAWDKLYDPRSGGGHDPAFPLLAPFKLKHKIESATVLIRFGLQRTALQLTDCTIAKVIIEPTAGGTTLVSLQVQCTPTLDKSMTNLFEHLGGDCELELHVAGYGDQQPLPLETKPAAANGHAEAGAPA